MCVSNLTLYCSHTIGGAWWVCYTSAMALAADPFDQPLEVKSLWKLNIYSPWPIAKRMNVHDFQGWKVWQVQVHTQNTVQMLHHSVHNCGQHNRTRCQKYYHASGTNIQQCADVCISHANNYISSHRTWFTLPPGQIWFVWLQYALL